MTSCLTSPFTARELDPFPATLLPLPAICGHVALAQAACFLEPTFWQHMEKQ